MNKRPSIKGRGADLFLGDDSKPSSQRDSIPLHQHTVKPAYQNTVKATFYLQDQTVSELDNLWLTLRKQKRGITKSSIVDDILKSAIAEKLKGANGKK